MTTDDEQPKGPIEAEPVPEEESAASIATPPAVANAHPYRERFLVPFVVPLLIVVGVVFYVLNISRIFLASKGTGAVVIAATVTVVILFGAALLSSASRMRSSSIGLIVVAALVLITAGGWITIGHSEVKKEATVTLGPPVGEINVTAEQSLKFSPAGTIPVAFDPNGLGGFSAIKINYHDAPPGGTHTFDFDDPTVVWKSIEVSNAGQVATEIAGFPKAGPYVYFCAIPGHRQAGMQGTINVTTAVKPQKVASSGATPTSAG
jgi:hypothetical protein